MVKKKHRELSSRPKIASLKKINMKRLQTFRVINFTANNLKVRNLAYIRHQKLCRSRTFFPHVFFRGLSIIKEAIVNNFCILMAVLFQLNHLQISLSSKAHISHSISSVFDLHTNTFTL